VGVEQFHLVCLGHGQCDFLGSIEALARRDGGQPRHE
jgi:hypothetical protein